MASVSIGVRTAGRDRRHHTREGCTGIEQSGDMNPQTLSDCAWCSARLLLTADYVVGDAFRLTVVSSHRFLAPSGDTARRRSPACTNWASDLELLTHACNAPRSLDECLRANSAPFRSLDKPAPSFRVAPGSPPVASLAIRAADADEPSGGAENGPQMMEKIMDVCFEEESSDTIIYCFCADLETVKGASTSGRRRSQ